MISRICTRKAVISIHPEYAEKIRTGEKTVEYRKTRLDPATAALVIWATAPVSRIIGEVELTGTIVGTPQEVWDATKDRGGISQETFENYFAGRDIAYAYELGEFREFSRPPTLGILGLSRPPQSFAYVLYEKLGGEDRWYIPRRRTWG